MLRQEITTAVLENYGVKVIDLTPLSGGNDAYAQTFRARTESKEDLFIKVRPNVDPGIVLSAVLHQLGIHAILAPLHTKQDLIAAPLKIHCLLVYPFIDGKNGFDQPLELNQWQQVGAIVRQVHDAIISAEIASSLRVESFQVEGVCDFLDTRDRVLTTPDNVIEEELGRIAKENAPTSNVCSKVTNGIV